VCKGQRRARKTGSNRKINLGGGVILVAGGLKERGCVKREETCNIRIQP